MLPFLAPGATFTARPPSDCSPVAPPMMSATLNKYNDIRKQYQIHQEETVLLNVETLTEWLFIRNVDETREEYITLFASLKVWYDFVCVNVIGGRFNRTPTYRGASSIERI